MLPPTVLEALFAAMPRFEDALLAAEVCRAWRDAARQDAVWQAQLARRYGSLDGDGPAEEAGAQIAVTKGAAAASAGRAPLRALDAFRLRHDLELAHLCPRCLSGPLVPVVYGYPRPQLLRARQMGLCVLGGDQLVSRAPSWACAAPGRACAAAWQVYPLNKCGVECGRVDGREEWKAPRQFFVQWDG